MEKISFSKNLTDKQSKFVDYYVAEGKTQTEAARLAGYSFPDYEGYRLVRQPRMIQVIQAARKITIRQIWRMSQCLLFIK